MSRRQVLFLIALFLILVVALLLRYRREQAPALEVAPWPTPTSPTFPLHRPTPFTPIIIGTRVLTPPPTVPAAVTPTYVIAQVGDELFQRMLAQQARDETFRYTTVVQFKLPFSSWMSGEPLEQHVEGVYAYGNRHHVVESGGALVIESIVVGDTLYTRSPSMQDAWLITELSPSESLLYRLDVAAAILSADVQVRRVGPDHLEGVSVPVTQYEVTVPPQRMAEYMAQLAAAWQTASPSDVPASPEGVDTQMLALEEPAVVWVGDDAHQYRLDFVFTVQTENPETRPTIRMSTTFRDFNDPSVRIEPPEGPFVRP